MLLYIVGRLEFAVLRTRQRLFVLDILLVRTIDLMTQLVIVIVVVHNHRVVICSFFF